MSLADVVEEVAGVERAILEHRRPLSTVSVARRMAWAARRKTTRVEDEAYSLMGIFGVNIPAIYGEGRNAFYRLQEEILKHIPDQSIFAWGPLVFERYAWSCTQFGEAPLPETTREDEPNGYLFAPSPTAFEHSSRIDPLPLDEFERQVAIRVPVPEYTITSYGIRTLLPLATLWLPAAKERRLEQQLAVHVAVLACADTMDGLVALLLSSSPGQNPGHEQYKVGCRYPAGFVRGVSLRCLPDISPNPSSSVPFPRIDNNVHLGNANPVMTTIYIPYRPFELTVESYATRHGRRLPPTQNSETTRNPYFVCPCEVVIPQWTLAALHNTGYTISRPVPVEGDDSNSTTVIHIADAGPMVCIVLSRGEDEHIYIGLGPCQGAHSSFVPRMLTAPVSFGKLPVQLPEATTGTQVSANGTHVRTCKAVHVQDWRAGSATFDSEKGTHVRLTVGAWTDYMGSGNDRGLYALSVEVWTARNSS
ncbi:hypothetical protein C2E23DRAFT_814894 [Lenzites betulinus]|nr:hypothetical protein C2E23DRAFT_814894 [Lenzites betulinus]